MVTCVPILVADVARALLSPFQGGDLLFSIVPGSLRLLTTPALDATGTGAYRDMRHRARVLFIRDKDYSKDDSDEERPTVRTGVVEQLMSGLTELWEAELAGDPTAARAIAELEGAQADYEAVCRQYPTHAPGAPLALRDHADPAEGCMACATIAQADESRLRAVAAFRAAAPFRITLIGHSMGAHPVTDILRGFPKLYYDEVVLMAPACSIQDFADSTLTYLAQHRETSCRLLTLHPLDEINDHSGFYTLPRGSLLEWIDGYVTVIDSPLDYTLGKWNNIMRALPVLEDRIHAVDGRFTIKGFGRQGDTPHDHGDFNDGKFWEPSFWALPARS